MLWLLTHSGSAHLLLLSLQATTKVAWIALNLVLVKLKRMVCLVLTFLLPPSIVCYFEAPSPASLPAWVPMYLVTLLHCVSYSLAVIT